MFQDIIESTAHVSEYCGKCSQSFRIWCVDSAANDLGYEGQ